MRLLRAASFFGLTLATASAAAGEFTIFIYETPAEIALRADPGAEGRAYWDDYAAFGAALAQAGAIRGGAPLDTASRVLLASDQAREEGQAGMLDLVLGGYFQIEAADAAAAETLASMAPTVRRGGAVELVGTLAVSAMTTD